MPNKNFKLKADDIKELTNFNEGCLATDKITVDGEKVGFMYREKPKNGYPDSGWRFLAGNEGQEYLDNPDTIEVYSVNTICNYDKDIIPYLTSDIGKAFVRNDKGEFVEDTEFKLEDN